MEDLLKSGASCNILNKRGNSAFHTAIMMKQDKMVELMLKYNAEVKNEDIAFAKKNKTSERILQLLDQGSSTL